MGREQQECESMKECGVLLHISSLPNGQGIGSFGKSAYDFVDFLKGAGQSYWQVLPLGVTSYGDSPYQTFSVNAGNPYFIDLPMLYEEGLIKSDTDKDWENGNVDYAELYKTRYTLLETIDKSRLDKAEYEEFCLHNADWLDDYALFMTIKKYHKDAGWYSWQIQYKKRDPVALAIFKKINSESIEAQKIYQYLFFKQWFALKSYANSNGIKIIGDMPIYIAYDSVDVWRHPEMFDLDNELNMIEVAGVPPDDFSETGQLWGNPLYNWDYMQKQNFSWWVSRIKTALALFDSVRIDHFRGFESYYAVPAAEDNAMCGRWRKGPGLALFDAVNQQMPDANIIAEDLGLMTQEVIDMLKGSGYPGMKVLLFAFDGNSTNDHLPQNYITDNVLVYTGTHDNTTAEGCLEEMESDTYIYADSILPQGENFAERLIKLAYSSVAKLAVVPMQDFLSLKADARMNTPSTLGCNWKWRMLSSDMGEHLARKLNSLAKTYKRVK